MPVVVLRQVFEIDLAAVPASYTVKVQHQAAQAQTGVEPPGHIDDLGVESWITVAQCFDTELVMLPESSRLRSLLPEDVGKVEKPHRLGKVMHTVFYIGSTDWCCAFGSQGYIVAALIFKGVHLLFDDIGLFTDAAGKELCILKGRGIYTFIAV